MTDRQAASSNATRLYYRVKEVAKLTGLGLRAVYSGIYDGSIPSRKIGNSRLIPASWLLANGKEAEEIKRAFEATHSPKNRYSFAFGPPAPGGPSHLVRLGFSQLLGPSFALTFVL
jgi:excisionase family DNA binding protein